MRYQAILHASPRFRSFTLRHSKGWFFFILAILISITILSLGSTVSNSPKATSANYSGPIVITKGGTYSGNWESRDADVAAVDVRTSEPVIIENSNVRGTGFLIRSQGYGADITVRNTRGYGLPPTPYTSYAKPRRFMAIDVFKNIIVENCYMQGTAGIYLGVEYTGNGSPSESICIRFNEALDINGQIYKGKERVQFVQLNYRGEVPHAEIAWNQVINRPGTSAVEDNINIYNSRGAPHSPILIHNNYIQGAFPFPLELEEYSGGGILTDSPGTDSLAATAYVEVYENQLVGLGNYCLGIAGGNHVNMHHNRAIVAAAFSNGKPYHFWTGGIWAKDYYKRKNTFANSMHHNTLAVLGKSRTWRNDIFDSTFVAAAEYNNVILPDSVTKELEHAEFKRWKQKLVQNSITIGPYKSI